MRIAVCDDQMDELNAIEDILKNVKDSNIESVEIYQDIGRLSIRWKTSMCVMKRYQNLKRKWATRLCAAIRAFWLI